MCYSSTKFSSKAERQAYHTTFPPILPLKFVKEIVHLAPRITVSQSFARQSKHVTIQVD